jgi:hypothetical protein
MMSLKHSTALLAASICLIAAPAAFASGRGNIPFGNGSGGGAQTGSSSGSGGGGSSTAPQGGGGGGTVTRSCTVSVNSTTGTAGTPGSLQAYVESPFTVPVGCPSGSSWSIQYVNVATGVVEHQDFAPTGLNESGGGNQGFTLGTSGTEVFIPASFNTTYLVRMLVEDSQGVITEQDQTVTTPPDPN